MKKTTLRQNIKSTDREWYVVDALNSPVLGRLATVIASTLMGKNRPDYTPHVDGGDYVVVLNSEQVKVTGAKESDKKYYRHSGYLGNLKTQNLAEVREKKPEQILYEAVKGMLPRNRLRDQRLKRLRLVRGDDHQFTAQKPKPLSL